MTLKSVQETSRPHIWSRKTLFQMRLSQFHIFFMIGDFLIQFSIYTNCPLHHVFLACEACGYCSLFLQCHGSLIPGRTDPLLKVFHWVPKEEKCQFLSLLFLSPFAIFGLERVPLMVFCFDLRYMYAYNGIGATTPYPLVVLTDVYCEVVLWRIAVKIVIIIIRHNRPGVY